MTDSQFWATAKLAASILDLEGISGSMVGTGALYAHGYNVPLHDVDFLVAKRPAVPPTVDANDKYINGSKAILEGVEVHFILSDDNTACFMTRNPKRMNDVPIGSVENALGLKRWANRPKDREFFTRWNNGEFKRANLLSRVLAFFHSYRLLYSGTAESQKAK